MIQNKTDIVSSPMSAMLPGVIASLLILAVSYFFDLFKIDRYTPFSHMTIILGLIGYCLLPPKKRTKINVFKHFFIVGLFLIVTTLLSKLSGKSLTEFNYILILGIGLYWVILQAAFLEQTSSAKPFSFVWPNVFQFAITAISLGICVGILLFGIVLIASLGNLLSIDLLIVIICTFISYSFAYLHQKPTFIEAKQQILSRMSHYMAAVIISILSLFSLVLIVLATNFYNKPIALPLEFYLYIFYLLLILAIGISPSSISPHKLKNYWFQVLKPIVFLFLPLHFIPLFWFFMSYSEFNGLTLSSFWFMVIGYGLLPLLLINSLNQLNLIFWSNQINKSALSSLNETNAHFNSKITFSVSSNFASKLFNLKIIYTCLFSILLLVLALSPTVIEKRVATSQVNRIIHASKPILIDFDLFESQLGQPGLMALDKLAIYTLEAKSVLDNPNYNSLLTNPRLSTYGTVTPIQSSENMSSESDEPNNVESELLQKGPVRVHPVNAMIAKETVGRIADYLQKHTDFYCMKPKADYLEQNPDKIWLVEEPTCFIHAIHPKKLDKTFTVYAIFAYENAFGSASPSLYLHLDAKTNQLVPYPIKGVATIYDAVTHRLNNKDLIETPEEYQSFIAKHFKLAEPQFKQVMIGGKVFEISDKNPDIKPALGVENDE